MKNRLFLAESHVGSGLRSALYDENLQNFFSEKKKHKKIKKLIFYEFLVQKSDFSHQNAKIQRF